MESKLTTKLFIGCPLKSDTKLQLQNSLTWKQSKIGTAPPLTEIYFHNKEYIGCFAAHYPLSLREIKETEKFILDALQNFCPKLESPSFKIVIFPQILVS